MHFVELHWTNELGHRLHIEIEEAFARIFHLVVQILVV